MKYMRDHQEQSTVSETLLLLQASYASVARSADHFLAVAPELARPEESVQAAPAPTPEPQSAPVEATPVQVVDAPVEPAVLTEADALRRVAEVHNETATYPVELWSNYENRAA